MLVGCSDDAASSNQPVAPSNPPPTATADEVMMAYVTAMKECDWKSCSNLLHPDALVEFAHLLRPMLHASKSDKALAKLGLKSREEIDVISPTELFVRLMALKMKLQPTLPGVYRSSTWTILGDVMEGDVTHVVCRMGATSSHGMTSSSVTVESLKRAGGEWRLLLSREFQGEAKGVISNPESDR